MTVLTSKTKIAEILEENHIVLLEDEVVSPDKEAELSDNKTIIITKIDNQKPEIAQAEEVVSADKILQDYSPITEKVTTQQIVIPFETITKEATGSGTKQNHVVQNGVNG
jgi:uncharacterized protein YabE (DUF348 family)